MSARMIFVSVLVFLLLTVPVLAANNSTPDLTIYQALQMAEKVEMGNFIGAIKTKDSWTIKGSNLNNSKPAELLINAKTGLITSAKNIILKAIILGENTYQYSDALYPSSSEFYKTNQVYNGFEIYQNDSRYFKMKHAIFIKTKEGFVAYFMTSGPGMTK